MESYFEKTAPENLCENMFSRIGKEGALLCVRDEKRKCNAMTVSWGTFGVLWGKNVCFLFVRESRYTNELLKECDEISLNFLGECAKKIMSYCGKTSGRNVDKISDTGLTLFSENGVDCISESEMIMICKKIYRSQFSKEKFADGMLYEKFYSNGDLHDIFIFEIEQTLKRKNVLKV